ncbi:MAG: sodium:calcium antiporter [Acidimicrobiia bacterium]|nr:sodium:calcium antiporter [Acidimicrobiia bacterium]MBT8192313.1 sodium:calcium antiporter [Acidimicrobiia bacterium]NNF87893.1 sodium:calcium antiporter [Acidimicrobiia bacterium]NNJ46918.1 sodium:calcium antiporter [Acidimicrobiia bacterium]NNL14607.1 sodium:calcium antiporter [Acidimicrobiia bacterium]
MLLALTFTLGGLAILPLVADRFVVAATRISRALGLSPILVGALLVGFGTSLPEIVVSGLAAAKGETSFAVANVVGSNVANLALVLGVAASIRPIASSRGLIRKEGSLVLIVTLLYVAIHINGDVQWWEGVILLIVLALALGLLIRWSEGGLLDDDDDLERYVTVRKELFVGVLTMGATVAAATILVEGAERLAVELDIQSAFIAATLVAVGTSLPELATAVAAVRRHEADLVLGNVLGSNLFNSLAVGGVAGVVGPGVIDPGFRVLLLAMLAITAFTGLVAVTGSRLARSEGAALLVVFALFVWLAGSNLA